MKKIVLPFFFMLMATVVFYSCTSVDSNDPKAVAQAFFKNLADEDLDGAAKYASKESKQTLDLMKKTIDQQKQSKDTTNRPAKVFADLVFEDAKIDGEKATINIYNKLSPDATYQTIPLLKQDGAWKVDFSMKTLMGAAKQQRADLQQEISNTFKDSTSKAVDAAPVQTPIISDSTK